MGWRHAVNTQQVSSRVWTVPNVISFTRLVLVPVFAVLVATQRWWAAVIVLILSGVSDWADGYLARRLGQETRLGKVLDPAADRLFIMVTLFAFAWAQVVPWWLVGVVIGRDIILGAVLPVLAARGYGPLPVSYTGKAGTFALMGAFPLLLAAQIAGGAASAVQVAAWAFTGWGLALYWTAGVLYLRQALGLVRDAS